MLLIDTLLTIVIKDASGLGAYAEMSLTGAGGNDGSGERALSLKRFALLAVGDGSWPFLLSGWGRGLLQQQVEEEYRFVSVLSLTDLRGGGLETYGFVEGQELFAGLFSQPAVRLLLRLRGWRQLETWLERPREGRQLTESMAFHAEPRRLEISPM